uniref:PPM-type phosphatase domain-containing protein n=1 Tax=Ciona savignyi TaxID=51511 RepID=H2ZNC9_CIOSA
MFGRVKNAVSDLFHKSAENNENKENHVSSKVSEKLHAKLVYQRPLFLGLDESEEKNAVDNKKRTPVTPKDINSLPFNSGYCEICNAGKTLLNEDCAVALTINIDVEQKYQTTSESCELNENNDHREANHVVKSDTANHMNGDDSNHVKDDATNHIQADSTINMNEDLNSNEVESKTTESKAIPIKTQCEESVHNDSISSSIRVDYFAIFDGHA